jgi:hypothetical protein
MLPRLATGAAVLLELNTIIKMPAIKKPWGGRPYVFKSAAVVDRATNWSGNGFISQEKGDNKCVIIR